MLFRNTPRECHSFHYFHFSEFRDVSIFLLLLSDTNCYALSGKLLRIHNDIRWELSSCS